MFVRELIEEVSASLQESSLFKKKLLHDIKNGEVFPAVRKGRLDFYYKGGKLFSYDKSFKTHIKFASVLRSNKKDDYILEEELKDVKLILDFTEAYERIKENCFNYSGVEAEGVSKICSNFSYAKDLNQDVVILDIEVSLESIEEERKQDRIDLLLFDRKRKLLRFYEAKHFSNKEIWSKQGTIPQVVAQVAGYKRQIKIKKDEIILGYSNYIEIVNKLFELNLESPIDIDPEVSLLLFGFDRDQLEGRFKSLFEQNIQSEKIKYYAIGNLGNLEILTMWNKCN